MEPGAWFATRFALGPYEAAFNPTTVDVGIELIAHESWQARPLLAHGVEERTGVLLDDLVFIAQADGVLNDIEKEMIDNLSQSWGVSIRVDGEVDL